MDERNSRIDPKPRSIEARQNSEHGQQKLDRFDLRLAQILIGARDAVVVQGYPGFHKGPSVPVLQLDEEGLPLHILWGLGRGTQLVSGADHRLSPHPAKWSHDFLARR